MFEAIARYHELYPEWWSFACKGCRDQGKPYLSRLTYAEISDLMHGLWLRAEAADFNTPVKAEIRSTAIALD